MSGRFTSAGINDLLVSNQRLLEQWHIDRFGQAMATNDRINTLVSWGLTRKKAREILAQIKKAATPQPGDTP